MLTDSDHLGTGLLDALLDGNGDSLQQFLQLKLLLLTEKEFETAKLLISHFLACSTRRYGLVRNYMGLSLLAISISRPCQHMHVAKMANMNTSPNFLSSTTLHASQAFT